MADDETIVAVNETIVAVNETNVVEILRLEPSVLSCGECDGICFHIYEDNSMVCLNPDCGAKTRFELFEEGE